MNEGRSPKAWAIQLAKLWRDVAGRPYPIDIREFALEYSVRTSPNAPIGEIREVTNLEGFEGGLYWLPGKQHWVILYQPNSGTPGRNNFTLAHELGHFVLHRNSYTEFRCSSENVLGQSSGGNDIEQQADVFASYLLMPADLFRQEIAGRTVDLAVLGQCATRFEVSLTAAALKWIELTTQCAVLVVARDGFIKWYRRSESAKYFAHKFFAPGTELPRESSAADGYAGLTATEMRQGVLCDPGIWVRDLGCREMGLVSDRYDLTISLLVFDTLPSVQLSSSANEDRSDDDDDPSNVWEPPRFK